ncbi:uncharacterized protein J4E78_003621 [Alternaria triticimaculans]|uniref:uncharacterized protein n=1 Tax=Alternaria triticimaculans TaxID=297637 RepID=UPI0020C224E2|nr:uncharacterized protein J4E78_003621 [Alternaria triticimaculans]KAI4666153.1 hypothetical protein J4E78_003621 [Alternaria triticimaculans]
MAEVVGLVASVVQLAGAGLNLSETLYHYVDGVATADRRIQDIANEVKLTSSVIKELGTIFEKNDTANLISENAVKTANETFKECFAVFTELDLKINRGKPGKPDKIGKMSRLMLPFKENKIELLRSQIEKLKSTLQLLMQVLIHAHQVSSEKYSREAEAKHREEIKQLLENKKQATKKYEESLRNFSISDGSTAVDDGDRSVQDEDDFGSSSNLFNAAGAMGSTINPDTIATCVDHVRSLLADIETLQLALARQVNGDDHSDHHQKAIGSYFLARSHLDSVLLGKSQANVTDAQMRQSSSEASGENIASAVANVTPPDSHALAALRDERARKEMKIKMEMEMERARIVAEARTKSADVSINDKEREAAWMIEREVRLEREARDQVRAETERERRAHGSVHRPALRPDSIEDFPIDFPPSAEYRQTKYREEHASPRRTSSENRELRKVEEERAPNRIAAGPPILRSKPSSSPVGDVQPRSISQAKFGKLEARARGERLWQEEMRRREGITTPARDDVFPKRGSRPRASLQPSQSVRDKPRSLSASYLLEERRPSTVIVNTATSPPKKVYKKLYSKDAPKLVIAEQRLRSRSRERPYDSSKPRPRLHGMSDSDSDRPTVPASMYRDTEPAWRKPRPYSLERGSRPTSMISERPRPSRRKSIDEVKDFDESAGVGGIIGAATSNRDQFRSRSPSDHSNEDAGIIRPSKRVQEEGRTKKREEKMLDEWGLKPRREGLEKARRDMKGKSPKSRSSPVFGTFGVQVYRILKYHNIESTTLTLPSTDPTGTKEKKQGRISLQSSAGAMCKLDSFARYSMSLTQCSQLPVA